MITDGWEVCSVLGEQQDGGAWLKTLRKRNVLALILHKRNVTLRPEPQQLSGELHGPAVFFHSLPSAEACGVDRYGYEPGVYDLDSEAIRLVSALEPYFDALDLQSGDVLPPGTEGVVDAEDSAEDGNGKRSDVDPRHIGASYPSADRNAEAGQ
jgi:hypothetical protein